MTIQDLKELKERVTNAQALEAVELAIKYKKLPTDLAMLKGIKIAKHTNKVFKTKKEKAKLEGQMELLDELISILVNEE